MSYKDLTRINIIGAGKLGETLARDIVNHKISNILSICNKSYTSSQKVASRLKQATAYKAIQDLPSAEITFITTPDDSITACANELANNKSIINGHIIIHCSGVLSSESLKCLQKKGCLTLSLHPMRSFTNLNSTFNDTFCAVEGDINAIKIVKNLFKPLQLKIFDIDKINKASYHCGGVFASNYLIAILRQSQLCYQQAGIDSKLALNIATALSQSTLNNVNQSKSLTSSLTGPLARGDLQTIEKHLKVIKPNTKKLYQGLAINLLELTSLSDEKINQIKKLLID